MSGLCLCGDDKYSHGKDGCFATYSGSGCEIHVCTCREFRPAAPKDADHEGDA